MKRSAHLRRFSLTSVICLALTGCSNLDLLAKLETPGGGQTTQIRIVSTNITSPLNTGGNFSATVTFSAGVNIPAGAISIDNGAAVTSLATVDNITWTFSLNGLVNATYTVHFSSGITGISGGQLVPFSVTFEHSGV